MDVTEPTDKRTNGTVTIELEISDPVMDLGIETGLLDINIEGSVVSSELAEHIWDEYLIDVEDHGVEVAE